MTLISKHGLSLAVLAALSLAAAHSAQAQTTLDANVFAGQTATATDPFPNATLANPSNFTDGGTTPFVFADNTGPEIASISGFNSGIGDIRFFDAPDFQFSRLSPSVIIGYSSTANAGLNPASYTLLNNGTAFTLATSNGGNDYLTPTNPAQAQTGPASNGSGTIHFSDVANLNIPTGTQSVLFEFTVATDPNGSFGSGVTEIQGFAPAIAAAPEPAQTAALAFFGLGLGVLMFKARKRAANTSPVA